jgi:hypothetical protein
MRPDRAAVLPCLRLARSSPASMLRLSDGLRPALTPCCGQRLLAVAESRPGYEDQEIRGRRLGDVVSGDLGLGGPCRLANFPYSFEESGCYRTYLRIE